MGFNSAVFCNHIPIKSSVDQHINEKLPFVCGKVVFLRVEQSKKKNPKSRRHLADDILSKIMFDENLAICLSLRFRQSIAIGLS